MRIADPPQDCDLTRPRIEHSPTGIDLPLVVRTGLRTAKVHDFLILREVLATL